jgi:hypothetical protein
MVKTSARKIYKNIWDKKPVAKYEVTSRNPGVNWGKIWENIWENKKTKNFEKELYYKYESRFSGLPRASQLCVLCQKEIESFEHIFNNCIKIQQAKTIFTKLLRQHHLPEQNYEKTFLPDYQNRNISNLAIKCTIWYVKSILEARSTGMRGGGEIN